MHRNKRTRDVKLPDLQVLSMTDKGEGREE